MEPIKIFVGFDQREAIAYHVFCQSLIEKSSELLQITPLALSNLSNYREVHTDGSNAFIYSRFLVPYLNNFKGWAIFVDGDMVIQSDITELWNLRDSTKAIQVVKHDYKTKANIKYLGNRNQDYPRKNWSSVILWNCEHPSNRILTPELIQSKDGAYLHRFSWIDNEDVGELESCWNWLASEFSPNPNAKIIHYTLGTPCFKDYKKSEMADHWHEAHKRVNQGIDI